MPSRLSPRLAAIAAALLAAAPAAAADAALDARALMLTVQRQPMRSWAGFGVYMGGGLVVTAAHVVGQNPLTPPVVAFGTTTLPVAVVKQGRYPDDDLAILRLQAPVPAALADRRAVTCAAPFRPGEPVIVATPDAAASSVVIAPEILPPDLRARYAASIRDVYTTGNSGSGVFDAERGCLLGIMSSKIEQDLAGVVDGKPVTRRVGVAKHFVPAADIRAFLDGVAAP